MTWAGCPMPRVSVTAGGSIPRHLAFDTAPDLAGVAILQFFGQRGLGEVLEAEGPRPPVDGGGADAGGSAVRGGGVGAAVDHGVGDFDAGGPAVHQEAADLGLEDVDEVGVVGEVGVGGVEGGGEVALEVPGGGEEFFAGAGGDGDGAGAEDFLGDLGVVGEVVGGGEEEEGGLLAVLRGGVGGGGELLGDAGDLGELGGGGLEV